MEHSANKAAPVSGPDDARQGPTLDTLALGSDPPTSLCGIVVDPPARDEGWTPERKLAFLRVLADHGVVADAALAAGVTLRSAYRYRHRADGRAFHICWEAALRLAARNLHRAAKSRAKDRRIAAIPKVTRTLGTVNFVNFAGAGGERAFGHPVSTARAGSPEGDASPGHRKLRHPRPRERELRHLSVALAHGPSHIRSMSISSRWRAWGRIPLVRTLLFLFGILLILLSPVVGAIPGPGGVIVFALGLGLVLKYSEWAKRQYVRFKKRHPNKGRWADWGMRRASARRRAARIESRDGGDRAPGD